MAQQLYWEDVNVGNEITPLVKIPTTRMLVQFAGASGDFNPLHYDDVFAKNQGPGRTIVHGALKAAWLGQMLNEWIGEEGFLKRYGCQYRSQDMPRRMRTQTEPEQEGETCTCRGVITKKYVEDGEHRLDCDIWVENSSGQKTTPGTATVVLPSKG